MDEIKQPVFRIFIESKKLEAWLVAQPHLLSLGSYFIKMLKRGDHKFPLPTPAQLLNESFSWFWLVRKLLK